jgi:NADH-quinone oxidoreductase subunit J
MAEYLFLFMAALVIASAFWVVFSPNLIHSAVSLLFTLFGTAGLYVFLYADFIAGTQIVIYVGGI